MYSAVEQQELHKVEIIKIHTAKFRGSFVGSIDCHSLDQEGRPIEEQN